MQWSIKVTNETILHFNTPLYLKNVTQACCIFCRINQSPITFVA